MDLKKFSDEELFLSAMKAEVDRKEKYTELADGVKNAFLKDKLRFLADEEDKHRIFLEDAYWNRFAGKEIELPEKSFVPLPEIWIPDEFVSISEVIVSAIEAELAAQEFYDSFANQLEDDPDLKKTLEYFAAMELGHSRILELEKENIEKFEEYDEYWSMVQMGI